MKNFKVNDDIRLKSPFWLEGEDLGGKRGKIVSTRSHILVQLDNYRNNPVKCFSYEISLVYHGNEDNDEDDLDRIFKELFDT